VLIRLRPIPKVTLHRKVMNAEGFTFSDGTSVPHGSYLAASSYTVHHLAENFADPDVFDGMFYKMRQAQDRDHDGRGVDTGGAATGDEVDVVRHQLTTPGASNLVFGLGKHVCPGRYVFCFPVRSPFFCHFVGVRDLFSILPSFVSGERMTYGSRR